MQFSSKDVVLVTSTGECKSIENIDVGDTIIGIHDVASDSQTYSVQYTVVSKKSEQGLTYPISVDGMYVGSFPECQRIFSCPRFCSVDNSDDDGKKKRIEHVRVQVAKIPDRWCTITSGCKFNTPLNSNVPDNIAFLGKWYLFLGNSDSKSPITNRMSAFAATLCKKKSEMFHETVSKLGIDLSCIPQFIVTLSVQQRFSFVRGMVRKSKFIITKMYTGEKLVRMSFQCKMNKKSRNTFSSILMSLGYRVSFDYEIVSVISSTKKSLLKLLSYGADSINSPIKYEMRTYSPKYDVYTTLDLERPQHTHLSNDDPEYGFLTSQYTIV